MVVKDIQSPIPKQNCWEFLECGREPGGKNGGRICWAISGTYCNKKMQGLFAKTQLSCRSCVFFKKVKEEEGIECYHLDKTLISLIII